MTRIYLLCFTLIFCAASSALAHFGMLIPSAGSVADKKDASLTLTLSFSHPMEMVGMPLAAPASFKVYADGTGEDLLPALKPAKVMEHEAWSAAYAVKKPGVYQFVMEPKPYWEPAENKYIVHYAKVVVDGFASGEGWDRLAGLPVEIAPLVRPTGLWTGNLFRGVVLQDGQPVPGAEIEVEWVNDGSVTPPNEAFITQVIKADDMGVFSYAMPKAGWWGFAALIDGPEATSPDGKPATTELGALMWVKATDMGGTK